MIFLYLVLKNFLDYDIYTGVYQIRCINHTKIKRWNVYKDKNPKLLYSFKNT